MTQQPLPLQIDPVCSAIKFYEADECDILSEKGWSSVRAGVQIQVKVLKCPNMSPRFAQYPQHCLAVHALLRPNNNAKKRHKLYSENRITPANLGNFSARWGESPELQNAPWRSRHEADKGACQLQYSLSARLLHPWTMPNYTRRAQPPNKPASQV